MSKQFERLFFALWPTQTVRQSLSERYSDIADLSGQGRLVIPTNFHITLHFLGNIPVERVACFIEAAKKVQSSSFELTLTQLGYFKRPKISWLGPVDIPQALFRLHSSLGEHIKHCSFKPELRPYQPHVTMARKINQAVATTPIKPVKWKVDSFVLVQSVTHVTGVRYRVNSTFPLKNND